MVNGLTGTKGGAGVWQRIISEMPEHEVYVEPFWGRGTIARRKRPARHTIGIDTDPAAVSSGRGFALMFLADGLQWLADYFCLGWPPPENSATRPGGGGQAARDIGSGDTGSDAGLPVSSPAAESTGGRSRTDPDAGSGGEGLPAEAGDPAGPGDACTFGGVPWERHFVYLDPPYLGSPRYYSHEPTIADHRRLCRMFLRLPCPAALSGYRTDMYAAELRGCRSITIPTVNRAGRRVEEIVWMNYARPARYHDTRFAGENRRERERIRRRVKTWASGLVRMGARERQAVFEACAAACDGSGR